MDHITTILTALYLCSGVVNLVLSTYPPELLGNTSVGQSLTKLLRYVGMDTPKLLIMLQNALNKTQRFRGSK